jgi:hypothetical protein
LDVRLTGILESSLDANNGLTPQALIYFDDPDAHAFFANPTREQKALLTEFERIANDFYYFGKASYEA